MGQLGMLFSIKDVKGLKLIELKYLEANQNRALILIAKQPISVQVQEVERLIRQCITGTTTKSNRGHQKCKIYLELTTVLLNLHF